MADITVADLLEIYQTKLATANHEVVLLTAQNKALQRDYDELEARIENLEGDGLSDARPDSDGRTESEDR